MVGVRMPESLVFGIYGYIILQLYLIAESTKFHLQKNFQYQGHIPYERIQVTTLKHLI